MRHALRVLFVAALTVGLLVLFAWQANWRQVWLEIRSARVSFVVFAVGATLLTYVLRALRWQYLLAPIGPTGFWNALSATVIGFAASAVLPARAGEILRPYLLARWEGLSATAAFATIILERLLDLLAVVLLLGAFLLLFDPGVGRLDPRVFGAVRTGGVLAAVGAILAFAMVFVLAGRPEAVGRAALGTSRVLPARLARTVARLVQLFAEGLAVTRQPARLFIAAALSIPLWLSIAVGIWLVTAAFHITMPFTGSFLLLALLVVGVSVPTPGAVGGFHVAYRVGVTAFFAAPSDRAVGAGLVLHAVSFAPVTVAGILLMLRAGLSVRDLKTLAARAPEAQNAAGTGTQDGPLRPVEAGVAGSEGPDEEASA